MLCKGRRSSIRLRCVVIANLAREKEVEPPVRGLPCFPEPPACPRSGDIGHADSEDVEKVSRRAPFNKCDHFAGDQIVEAIELHPGPQGRNRVLKLNRSVSDLKANADPF